MIGWLDNKLSLPAVQTSNISGTIGWVRPYFPSAYKTPDDFVLLDRDSDLCYHGSRKAAVMFVNKKRVHFCGASSIRLRLKRTLFLLFASANLLLSLRTLEVFCEQQSFAI